MSDVYEHLVPARTCVVAFASGGGEFSGDLPHFEFGRFLGSLDVAYVLLRDSTSFSHQYGIAGIGKRGDVCRYLDKLARGHDRLVMVGLSVGALAALMYGQLVPATDVIALSPYTSLGGNPAVVFGGEDWRERCPFPTDIPLMIDLAPLFTLGAIPRIRCFVSDGEGTSHDREHAERIGVTDITLVPGASHSGLGKLMRDNGMLRDAILASS